MCTNNVLLYGGELFPAGLAGAAGSKRLINIAKIIKESGHHVHILAVSLSGGLSGEISAGIKYTCVSARSHSRGKFNVFHSGKAYVQKLKRLYSLERIDRVFFVSAFANVVVPVIIFCKRNGIEIDLIANDRYEKNTQTRLQYLNSELSWRCLYRLCRKVIATSTYFENYFKRFGAEVIRIPCVYDESEFHLLDRQPHDGVVISFAGDVRNRKEYIDNVVRALDTLEQTTRERFILALAGCRLQDLEKNLGANSYLLEKHKEVIKLYPFLKGKEYERFLQSSDYTVLIRPDMRYARAGFATKFGESMINSVPVISNPVGDIAIYLQDGVNGFLTKDETPEAIAETLKRISLINQETYEKMRRNAYEQAHKHFCNSNYTKAMAAFLVQNSCRQM